MLLKLSYNDAEMVDEWLTCSGGAIHTAGAGFATVEAPCPSGQTCRLVCEVNLQFSARAAWADHQLTSLQGAWVCAQLFKENMNPTLVALTGSPTTTGDEQNWRHCTQCSYTLNADTDLPDWDSVDTYQW